MSPESPVIPDHLMGSKAGIRTKYQVGTGLKKATVRIRKPTTRSSAHTDHAAEASDVGTHIMQGHPTLGGV